METNAHSRYMLTFQQPLSTVQEGIRVPSGEELLFVVRTHSPQYP